MKIRRQLLCVRIAASSLLLLGGAISCSPPTAPSSEIVPLFEEQSTPPPDECGTVCPVWSDRPYGGNTCDPTSGSFYGPEWCDLRDLSWAELESVFAAMNLIQRNDLYLMIYGMLGTDRFRAYDNPNGEWGDSHHAPTPFDGNASIHIWRGYSGTPFGGGAAELLETLCHEAAHIVRGNSKHDAAFAAEKGSCKTG